MQSRHPGASRRGAMFERKIAVMAMLAKLSGLPPAERMNLLATEVLLPLEAVPKELLDAALDEVVTLPDPTRDALLQRLDRRSAGRWKRLRGRLNTGAG